MMRSKLLLWLVLFAAVGGVAAALDMKALLAKTTVCFENRAEIHCGDEAPRLRARDWMSRLGQDVELTRMAVPGTHQSGSLVGGSLVQCQVWNITDQLHAGIRFLDVRVKLSQQRNVTGGHVEGMPRPGQLEVYHGPMYQHLSFAQVLGEVANFLKSYPSETVLMKLNEELYTKEERGKPEFVKKLSDELKKYHDILWCCDYIPSMKDMRGKVVIIRNYKGEPYFGLSKDLFWVQNMWDIPTLWHLDKKKAAFKRLFDLSGSLGYLREPVINYASATGWAAHPHMVAARMNKYVLELISIECSPWKVGIVPMDFPGYGILHRIIDSNFCQDSKTPGPKHYGDCRAQWNMASFGCKVTRDRCAPGHSVQVKHFWKLWKCMCTCQDNAAMTDRGCGTIRENWCD